MNQIVRMVSQKTGLDEQKAKQAVDTVLGFLRDKLPAPIAAQVEKAMTSDGEGKGKGGLGDIAKNIGGMMGGEKSKR